jgi:hypothetical protein
MKSFVYQQYRKPIMSITVSGYGISSISVVIKSSPSACLPDSSLKPGCIKRLITADIRGPELPIGTVAEPSPAKSHFGGKRYDEWRCLERSKSPAWDRAIDMLAAEIKVRHCSRKTLKTSADWRRKFLTYLADKPPEDLTSFDVKAYLTHLAVQQRVASSTQNQAFNALLFLFRHVLNKDFGDLRDVPRTKGKTY